MMQLRYIQDEMHGWIGFPEILLGAYDIKPSSFSYHDPTGVWVDGAGREYLGMVWLEEDCDAPCLLAALDRANVRYKLNSQYHGDESPIRNLERWKP